MVVPGGDRRAEELPDLPEPPGLGATPGDPDAWIWPDADIRVCSDGSADFDDLQPAIDASAAGDTIAACPGSYGPIHVPWSFNVAIVGPGPELATIDGNGGPAVVVRDGALSLSGFTVTGVGIYDPWYPEAAAFSVHEGTVEISDCVVTGTTGPFALLFDENTLVMEDVRWEDNATDLLWFLYEGSEATIRGNVVQGGVHESIALAEGLERLTVTGSSFAQVSIATATSAFVFHGEGRHEVENNVFYELDDLEPWGGRVFDGPVELRNNIVSGCDAWDLAPLQSSYAIWWDNDIDYERVLEGTHNLFVDPMFVDPEAGDFRLQPGSPAIDAGDPAGIHNDADGTRNDLGMYGGH